MTAEQLKAWRKRQGWTLHDVAGRLGISYSYYWNLENGLRPLTQRDALAVWAIEQGVIDYDGETTMWG